jgi:hypothetical protein
VKLYHLPIWLFLDLLSLPGTIGRWVFTAFLCPRRGLEFNARWHLNHTCPYCPQERRNLRDPLCEGVCAWELAWKAKNYDIPPHFGLFNLVTQYLGRVDLSKFSHMRKKT